METEFSPKERSPEQEIISPTLTPEEIETKLNALTQENNQKKDEEKISPEDLQMEAIFELRQEQIGQELKVETQKLTTESKWQKFFQSKPGKILSHTLTIVGGTATNVSLRSALSATVGFGWAAAIASGAVGGGIGAYKARKSKEKEVYQAEDIYEELGIDGFENLLENPDSELFSESNSEKITIAMKVLDDLISRQKLSGEKENIERLIRARVQSQALLETLRTAKKIDEDEIPPAQQEISKYLAEQFIQAQQEHLENSDQDEMELKTSQAAQKFIQEKKSQVNWATLKAGLIGAGIGASISGILTHFWHPATGYGGGEIDPTKAADNATMDEKFRQITQKLAHGYLNPSETAQTGLAEAKKTLIENQIDYDRNLAEGLRGLVQQNQNLVSPGDKLDDSLVKAMYEMMSYPAELIPLAKSQTAQELANAHWLHHLSPVARPVTKKWLEFIGSALFVGNYVIAPASVAAGYVSPKISQKLPANIKSFFESGISKIKKYRKRKQKNGSEDEPEEE